MGWFLLGAFTLTLFQSALLLFWVQPMVGKILLPYLGGTPAVWNTCMVFFQALLLGGYSYAHMLAKMPKRLQTKVHCVLLAAGFLPLLLLRFQIEPLTSSILPTPTESNPIPWLLGVLLLSAGLPFFAVSTTAPLLQRWFAGTTHSQAKDPYFLYAASNLGSMLTLLSYPLFIEPNFTIQNQTLGWTIGYGIFFGLVLLCAVVSNQSAREEGTGKSTNDAQVDPVSSPAPSLGTILGWVTMAFIPSSVMIGATTHITTDIAPMPLLWILPLALYLFSFIVVFSRVPGWLFIGSILGFPLLAYLLASGGSSVFQANHIEDLAKRLATVAGKPTGLKTGEVIFYLCLALGGVFLSKTPNRQHAFMIFLLPIFLLLVVFLPTLRSEIFIPEVEAILAHLALLFIVSMVCHGELARSRPNPEHLTIFYLAMSLGGVLGGLFNTVFAPLAFSSFVEYPLIAALACMIIPGFLVPARWSALKWISQGLVFSVGAIVALILAVQAFVPRDTVRAYLPPGRLTGPLFNLLAPALEIPPLVKERNFFGAFRIEAIQFTERYFNPLSGEYIPQERVYHRMLHGTTNHGMQLFDPVELRTEPITYFQRTGAIGQIFKELGTRATEKKRAPRVAILGVGTGTLAGYAEKDWALTLFEIDPAMVRYASDTDKYFTYMTDARKRGATVDVKLGDGRKVIEKFDVTGPGKFDILFMDAFASDSVPVHLLTREAFKVYFDKLEDDGMVVVNIANRYLDFEPVLANLAQSEGWRMILQKGQVIGSLDKYATSWVVISKKGQDLDRLASYFQEFQTNEGETWTEAWQDGQAKPGLGVWTDNYSNIVNILNWGKD